MQKLHSTAFARDIRRDWRENASGGALLEVVCARFGANKKPGEPGFCQNKMLLDLVDVCGLLAFGAVDDVEGHLLVFGQALEATALNGGEVGEEVFTTAVRRNEAKTLGIVELFNGTGCHLIHP